MVVGMCRIELSLTGNTSLKGKRSVVRRVVDRVRARFKVSMAEVDAMDVHQTACLGFAVVSNDGAHAVRMMDTIVAFVEHVSDAPLVDVEKDLVHFDDVEPAAGPSEARAEGDGGR
jgi:uncharacterized protein